MIFHRQTVKASRLVSYAYEKPYDVIFDGVIAGVCYTILWLYFQIVTSALNGDSANRCARTLKDRTRAAVILGTR